MGFEGVVGGETNVLCIGMVGVSVEMIGLLIGMTGL